MSILHPEEVQASIDEREKMRAEVLARREREDKVLGRLG